jgi:hypothetical protein
MFTVSIAAIWATPGRVPISAVKFLPSIGSSVIFLVFNSPPSDEVVVSSSGGASLTETCVTSLATAKVTLSVVPSPE